MSASPPEADLKPALVLTSASDPKATFSLLLLRGAWVSMNLSPSPPQHNFENLGETNVVVVPTILAGLFDAINQSWLASTWPVMPRPTYPLAIANKRTAA